MDTFASRIKSWNLGAEFEIEGDAATKAIKYNIFLDYLNAAEQTPATTVLAFTAHVVFGSAVCTVCLLRKLEWSVRFTNILIR